MKRTVGLETDATAERPAPPVSPAVQQARRERNRLRIASDAVLVGYGVFFLAGVLAHQIGTGLAHLWAWFT